MAAKQRKGMQDLISERINNWESGNTKYAKNVRDEEIKSTVPRLVVTISREAGCGGYAIGEMLSSKLGLVQYGREIVELIAKDKKISARVVSTLDEKGESELTHWINDVVLGSKLSSFAYLMSLKRVVFTIATHGNAVILGRGGNFLVPPEKRIAIRLVAPLETRLKNIMERTGYTEKGAQTYIEKIDKERRQFIRKYFERDIADPTLNDVVINTAAVKPEAIVKIVKAIQANRGKA